MSAKPDYYAILGVSRDASPEDIKHAFRKLALAWHEDTSTHPDPEERKKRFKEINEAKEVLLDPVKRAAYDREMAADTGRGTPHDEGDVGSAEGNETSEVRVEPEVIDFGVLEPDGPSVEAQVVISWNGPEPSLTIPPYGDWWARAEIGRPLDNPQSYIITLEAQAHSGMSSGRYRSEFNITVDGNPRPVKLTARVVAAPSKPSPVYDAGRAHTPSTPPLHPPSVTRAKITARGWLFLGLVATVIIIVVAIASSGGNHEGQGTSSGSTVANGLLKLSSSPTLANSTSFLLGNSDLFIMGSGTLTLWRPNGTAVWSENASISDLITNDSPEASPQISANCAIADDGGGAGLDAEFISLDTGKQRAAAGYGILSGNRAAWSDGTIRDACTGAVLGRAAPSSAYSFPECLYGSVVIASGGFAEPLTAWRAGHELWQRSQDDDAVCDSNGTTLILNAIDRTITRINAITGQAYWSAKDPTCTASSGTHCLAPRGAPYILSEIGTEIIVSGVDSPDVAAFSTSTGRVLWQRTSGCMLATRPSEGEVLVGPCPAPPQESGNSETASVVNAGTGRVIKDFVGGYNQWSANTRQMLVVDNQMGAARIVNW